ncbi:MAG: hypothetical protein DRO52_02135 [Candidatus Hecatellales archaeon]|nr:MAG: hypothetical protein DRO52_02135 [Candidatus Hecatellales archaeon]
MEDLARVKVDSREGSLSYLGAEWILLRVEALQGMFDETVKAFGSGAYTIWYLAGKGAGRSMARLIIGLKEETLVEEIVERVCRELTRLGWGRFEAEKIDVKEGKYRFRVYNNPFARGKEAVKETACLYIKGYLEGLMEALTGREVKLRERVCVAEGAPYCEFESE